jgi:hypothetical protein
MLSNSIGSDETALVSASNSVKPEFKKASPESEKKYTSNEQTSMNQLKPIQPVERVKESDENKEATEEANHQIKKIPSKMQIQESLHDQLEEIAEVEHSEFESSTIDDRVHSTLANPTECSFTKDLHYQPLPDSIIKNQSNLPILFIDIKISHDKISRLVLYKNQSPFEAAVSFIKEHNIPSKLQEYLIKNVQAHYDKIKKY